MKTKKIKLYQLPLTDRIFMILSAMLFIALAIFAIIEVTEYIIVVVIAVSFAILYSILIFSNVFHIYISLDFEKGKFIHKESPFKKSETALALIKEIKYTDGYPNKSSFTLDIICNGFTEQIDSWSTGSNWRMVMLFSYRRQKRRLLKFAAKCNEMLRQNKT